MEQMEHTKIFKNCTAIWFLQLESTIISMKMSLAERSVRIFGKKTFRIKNFFDKDAPYPNCFGNLLTPQVVLTTLKCFIKVKAVREYYGLPQKYKTVENDSGIFLHLIFIILQFETSSLMNWLFSLFQT